MREPRDKLEGLLCPISGRVSPRAVGHPQGILLRRQHALRVAGAPRALSTTVPRARALEAGGRHVGGAAHQADSREDGEVVRPVARECDGGEQRGEHLLGLGLEFGLGLRLGLGLGLGCWVGVRAAVGGLWLELELGLGPGLGLGLGLGLRLGGWG